MRVLVAVMSCQRDRGYHGQIRETWASRPWPKGLDVRFFVGRSEAPALGLARDEVRVDAPDGFDSLALKLRAMAGYALAALYDWMFKCDTDTYVHLGRLATVVPEGRHYVGWMGPFRDIPPYGGSGYWLSRRALRVLAEAPEPMPTPDDPIEEHWAARELAAAGVLPSNDEDHYSTLTPPWAWPTIVTYHPHDKSMLDPSRLRELHSKVLGAGPRTC